ncbi:MAG: hypothetical protein OEZ06_09360 [Myxococcales bacterium]|nr:hypothetical protein [Myxococcales bacterium]
MDLSLHVISLRYSSWSIRALLPLWHAGAEPKLVTAELDLSHQGKPVAIVDYDAHVREAAVELRARERITSPFGA